MSGSLVLESTIEPFIVPFCARIDPEKANNSVERSKNLCATKAILHFGLFRKGLALVLHSRYN
jgi:ribonuclease HIII